MTARKLLVAVLLANLAATGAIVITAAALLVGFASGEWTVCGGIRG